MFQSHLLSTFFSALLLIVSSCDAQIKTNHNDTFVQSHTEQFEKYWYAGEAEINHYDLSQIRYGEDRHGDAVLIFVTEDFLLEKQVKKEYGDENAISVLKLNAQKKFITGIYDYSIMTSVFTPINYRKYPATLKLTFSSQDWCGQSFAQMNMKNGKLNYQQRSYFQSEADVDKMIDATYVEEDIWTRMRLEPQMLPLGKIRIVPSEEFMRLNHIDIKPYDAVANLVLQVNDLSEGKDNEFYGYTLKFSELDRILRINCQSRFPFKILSWEETTNASNPSKALTTKAKLSKSMMLPYWEKNKNAHQSLRDSLGMNFKMRN